MIPLCSMHTHTSFCDGNNTVDEMVCGAVECGCKTIGFSGHAPMTVKGDDSWTMSPESMSDYVKAVKQAREKYVDKIEVLLGIEQDYFSPEICMDFDYIIGSVHCVQKDGETVYADLSPEDLCEKVRELYNGDYMELVKDYYELVSKVVDKTGCDIIGHIDVITKFNEKNNFVDTSSKLYRDLAVEAVDALIVKDKLFEINTGAISRGWKSIPYPESFILKRIAEKGARVIVTSDAHSKDNILFAYDDAVEYARFCGIKSLCIYENKKIKTINI